MNRIFFLFILFAATTPCCEEALKRPFHRAAALAFDHNRPAESGNQSSFLSRLLPTQTLFFAGKYYHLPLTTLSDKRLQRMKRILNGAYYIEAMNSYFASRFERIDRYHLLRHPIGIDLKMEAKDRL
ncbi:MAG: hypothetical protein AAGE99_01340 [Chlamydiota bacterium]